MVITATFLFGHFSGSERACVLWKAIGVTRAAGEVPVTGLKRKLKRLIADQPGVVVDYVEVVDAESLRPLKRAVKGARLLLAVTVGGVRLIDNAKL